MKYLIATLGLSVGLLGTAGTASAQHHGGHHNHGYANSQGYGSHQGYGAPHANYNFNSGGYVPHGPRGYSAPGYGGYSQPGYDAHIYSRPPYSAPGHGGGYSGHHYDGHGIHHDRPGYR